MGVITLLFGLRTYQTMYLGEVVYIFDRGLREAFEDIMFVGAFFMGLPMEFGITSDPFWGFGFMFGLRCIYICFCGIEGTILGFARSQFYSGLWHGWVRL